MTKEELIEALHKADSELDTEAAHIKADELLLEYIGDEDIAEVFEDIHKWYS